MKKIILLCLLLITTNLVFGQTKFRSAVILHQSVGGQYYNGINMNCSPPPTTTAYSYLATYNSAHGYTGANAVTFARDGLWLVGGEGSGQTSWNNLHHSFDNDAGFTQSYAKIVSHRSTYDIIHIKTCFSWSAGVAAGGSASDTLNRNSVYNTWVAKWHIRSIAQKMATDPNTFWVLWTMPAPAPNSNINACRRDLALYTWMKDTLAAGLDITYGAFPTNIYVFDIFRKTADADGRNQYPNYCCSTVDGHPNAAAVNYVAPLLVTETFNAAITYESGLIGKHLAENYPKPARAAWQFTCDWEASRYRLALQNEADTAALHRAKAINDSVYYIWSGKDWNIGGMWHFKFSDNPATVYMPSVHYARTAPNPPGTPVGPGYVGYYANISNYCSTSVATGNKMFWQWNPDSLFHFVHKYNGWTKYFDGMYSNGTHSTPYSWVSTIDLNYDGVADNSETPADAYRAGKRWHEGYNLALKRWQDTSTAYLGYAPLYFSWTISSVNRAGSGVLDTLAIHYSNGQWWENARGDAAANNAIGGANSFEEWCILTDGWLANGYVSPLLMGITTIMDRGGGSGKDDYAYARWWIAWTALTSSYIAFHSTDPGSNHHDAVYFEEFEKNLGAYTSVRQLVPGKSSIYVRFFQNGAIILNANRSATPQTVNESDLLSLTAVDTPYYRYWGNIDTTNNNGARFTSVTMTPVYEGSYYNCDPIFLSTTVDTVVADVVIDNTSGATSPGCATAVMDGFSRDAGADGDVSNWNGQAASQLNHTYTNSIHLSNTPATHYRQHYAPADATVRTATYTPTLNREGWWILYEWHGWYGTNDGGASEASNARLLIQHARGDTTVYINQLTSSLRGQWNMIDTFYYAPTQNKSVVLSNVGANGYVVADAFRWKLLTSESGEEPPEPPEPPAKNYKRKLLLKTN
jgi:hypothetical protein